MLGEPTGKADFAFHRAIAAATNNPFYVEMLDALGDRTIPCDVTSPWCTDDVLSDEYQAGLQREHLRDPEGDLGRRCRCRARGHARASHRQPAALPRAAARPAGGICRLGVTAGGDRIRSQAGDSNDQIMPIHDYTSRFAIDPAAAAAMGTDELRHNFHIGDLFEPGKISLTYTHYDRMIVGGAMPVEDALALEAIKPTGTKNFLDRRELIAVNIGGAGTVTADGETHAAAARAT